MQGATLIGVLLPLPGRARPPDGATPGLVARSWPAISVVQTPPSLVPRGLVEIVAPVTLNDRLVGEINVRADATGNGDIDAPRLIDLIGDLLDDGLRAALIARISGRPRMPFAALNVPPLSVIYDPAALEVRVRVPVSRMRSQTMSIRGNEAPDPKRFTPQASYAGGVAIGAVQRIIETGPNSGRSPLLLSADGFVTVGDFPGITLRSGGLFTERPGRRFQFERAQTRLSYDSFSNALRAVAGEFTPIVSGFQGSAPVLGLGIARDYAGIRPFDNIRPSGRGAVTLDRPSTVIVEVNGLETRRLQLDPGRYQLTDLSAVSGANDVRLFVQDDLGRREVASAAFFTATSILAPGLTDFGLAVGKRESVRTRYGGPMIATGFVRRGLTGSLTVGGGAQYAAGNWQAYGEAVVGTPLGLFRLQGSASDVGGRGGRAASLDWIQTIEAGQSTWNLAVLSSMRTLHFASPFDRTARSNDERWRIDARIDWRRGPLGLGLVGGFARTRSRTEQQDVTATGFYTTGRFALSGSFGFERFGRDPWKPRALLGVSLQMGPRATASLRGDTRRGAIVAEVSRFPVDQVGDVSGRLQIVRDDDRIGLAGDVRYFGNRLIASAEQNLFYAQVPGALASRETVLRAATFIGIADGSVAIGRPPIAGFAIYDRHHTLKGSHVEVRDEANLLVGRHDLLGNVLVPFNRAFSPVYQTFGADPLPAGYDLGEGRLAALPGAFSGYRVAVGSDASRVAVGYLIAPAGPIAEMAGTVERIGGGDGLAARPFFTNAVGRFAVDRLAPGTYRMLIGTTEVAQFTIDRRREGLIDVGKLVARAP